MITVLLACQLELVLPGPGQLLLAGQRDRLSVLRPSMPAKERTVPSRAYSLCADPDADFFSSGPITDSGMCPLRRRLKLACLRGGGAVKQQVVSSLDEEWVVDEGQVGDVGGAAGTSDSTSKSANGGGGEDHSDALPEQSSNGDGEGSSSSLNDFQGIGGEAADPQDEGFSFHTSSEALPEQAPLNWTSLSLQNSNKDRKVSCSALRRLHHPVDVGALM